MSELYAKVDLTLVTGTLPIDLATLPSAQTTQTYNGQQYTVGFGMANTGGLQTYRLNETLIDGTGTYTLTSPDLPADNTTVEYSIPGVVYGEIGSDDLRFNNDVNVVAIISDEELPIITEWVAVQPTLEEIVTVGDGSAPSAPAPSQQVSISGVLEESFQVSETDVVTMPTYVWVDLGPASSALFTTGADRVNFNNDQPDGLSPT